MREAGRQLWTLWSGSNLWIDAFKFDLELAPGEMKMGTQEDEPNMLRNHQDVSLPLFSPESCWPELRLVNGSHPALNFHRDQPRVQW